MNTEVINTRTAKISFISDEILRVDVLEDTEVEEEDARENYLACKKLAGEKKMAILIDSRVRTTATKEARDFSSGALVSKTIMARAILTNSMAVKLLGNFYIRFHKPISPTQLFSEEKDAIQWLQAQLLSYHTQLKS
jgi:hypothetical protein